MKKARLIFAYIMLIVLVGSGTYFFFYFSKPSKSAKVVTTIFPIYDICRNLLDTDDSLLILQDNGMDMHSYEPTASDKMAISQAELFIHIGGNSDKWVGDIVRTAENVNLKTLCLMDIVNKVNESHDGILEEHEHEHEHEHEDESEEHEVVYDEHIWLSIKNMIAMANSIAEKLTIVYPERQEIIQDNLKEYVCSLESLDSEYAEACENKENTMVVADRFPFIYLAQDYGIKYLAAFSGCTADSEASASTITKLIDKINNDKLDFVCVLETSNMSIADKVVDNSMIERDVEVLTLNSCQSVGFNEINNISYLDIMRANLEVLKKVLSR